MARRSIWVGGIADDDAINIQIIGVMKRARNTKVFVRVGTSQQRIIKAKYDLYGRHVTLQKQSIGSEPAHGCNEAFCNPQNESDLIQMGVLCGPALTRNVWVCDRGVTHVCTPELCLLGVRANMGEIVCPLSGLVLRIDQRPEQSSDPDWKPHWKPVSVAEQRRSRKRPRLRRSHSAGTSTPEERAANVKKNLPKRADVTRRAERVVETLLYSRVRRQQNEAHKRRCMERAARDVKAYRMQQKNCNQLPRLPHIMQLVSNAWLPPAPFTELQRSENIINLYGAIVTQIWDRVLRFMLTPWESGGQRIMLFEQGIRPSVDNVILGTLYMMREGYSPNNQSMVPSDPFLAHGLPTQKDLPLFNFAKREVAPGLTLLRNMYNRALECHVPPHYLRLDFEALRQYGYGIAPSMQDDDQGQEAQQHQQHQQRQPFKSVSRYHVCTQCRQRFTTADELDDHYCW